MCFSRNLVRLFALLHICRWYMIFLGWVYLEGFHLYQGAVIHWQLAEPASNVSSAVSAEPSAIFLPHMLQRSVKFSGAEVLYYSLGEIKAMSAGVSRYPAGKTEKQAVRRARELPGT